MEQTKKQKISFEIGVALALAGTAFVIGGQIFDKLTTRFAGYIIALIGFTIMAQRLYSKIKEKARAKALANQ